MKTHRLNTLAGIVALALFLSASSAVRADDLKIDAVHSSAVFWAHHFSAGYVSGTFSGVTGTIKTDGDVTKTSFDVTIDATTLDTRNDRRNDDLKGPDYFDVKQFQTMTFKSTAVKAAGDNKMEVTGDLTIHGVTKSITVTIENTGTGKGMKGETHVGYMADFKIKRTDFGINPKAPDSVVGDDVRIMIALEGIAE